MLTTVGARRKPHFDPVLRSYGWACGVVGLRELRDLFASAAYGNHGAAERAATEWAFVGDSLKADIDDLADQALNRYLRARKPQ